MKYILPSLSLILLVPVMLMSENIREAMPQILFSVSQVVFCTLFPMNVLLRVFCFSPVAERISRSLSKTRMWRKTGLSASYLPSVMSGQLSGFPMTACLLPNGKNKDLALALGSLASPAFMSAILSPRVGLHLWLEQIIVLWLFVGNFKKTPEKNDVENFKSVSFSEALSSGISSAVAVSGAMIFFSCIIAMIPDVTALREGAASFLEIGTAARVCKTPVFRAVAFSFGGLSALAQISFCAENTSVKPYVISRFLLFLPTFTFFVFEELRIFQTLLLIFLFLWQINRSNTCKKV